MTMKLIETKTLVANALSIEFTSIPQDGTDLFIVCSLRQVNSAVSALNLSFNGVGGTSYSDRRLEGTGSTTATGTRTSQAVIRTTGIVGSGQTANTFSSVQYYIQNYSGSTNKLVSIDAVTENNGTEAFQELTAGLFSNTGAITSVLFTSNAGSNFVSGSTISLYKITKGSDGIVTTS
jgi:hypothetical protein